MNNPKIIRKKTPGNSREKWTKPFKKALSKGGYQNGQHAHENVLSLLVIREMQIKPQ